MSRREDEEEVQNLAARTRADVLGPIVCMAPGTEYGYTASWSYDSLDITRCWHRIGSGGEWKVSSTLVLPSDAARALRSFLRKGYVAP